MKMRGDPLPPLGTTQRWVIDVMALTGDAVDNVPGVPGIGIKTAKRLMARWHSLDAILLSAMTGWTDYVMTPRLSALLRAHIGQALLCRDLVRLYDRVPVRP